MCYTYNHPSLTSSTGLSTAGSLRGETSLLLYFLVLLPQPSIIALLHAIIQQASLIWSPSLYSFDFGSIYTTLISFARKV